MAYRFRSSAYSRGLRAGKRMAYRSMNKKRKFRSYKSRRRY